MRILVTAALCVFALQTTDQSQSTPALTHRIVLPADIEWQDDGGDFSTLTSWASRIIPGCSCS